MKYFYVYFLLFISFFSVANDKQRGRYWYQHEQIEEEVKTEEEPVAEQPKQYSKPSMPDMKELLNYHPEQIRKLYTEVHEYHVMQPTMDTATDLLILENVLAKKTRGAASVKAMAALHHPELTGVFENPTAPSIKSLVRQNNAQMVSDRLHDSHNDHALLLFTQPGCKQSEAFKGSIDLFKEQFGWDVAEIDISKDFRSANRFNIQGTPTTILIKRGDKNWLPIAQNAIPYTTLTQNINQGIRYLSGEINEKQWLTSDVQTNSYFDPTYVYPSEGK